MNTNEAKMQEVLKSRGIEMAEEIIVKEEIPEEAYGIKQLMKTYYVLLNTVDIELTYWYNRVYWENTDEIPMIRRAKALAATYAHIIPTIQPYEKLVINKTKYVRGAYPFPWVSCSFFNAQAEALLAQAAAPARSEADEISIVAAGGGNVTQDFGEVISLAKKFGIRKESIPVLVKASKPWKDGSVEALSYKYTDLLPHADVFHAAMDSVICMFDSFCIPQGREVINYYVPLQYGYDRILEICDEKIAELLGEAGTDCLRGMERGYYYIAIKEFVKGMQRWCLNFVKQAKYLASIEPDPELVKNYEEIAEVMENVAHRKPQTFREALQHCVLSHISVINEDPMSGMSIGRIGQVLQPFYEKSLRDGNITREEAIELLEYHRLKIQCIECFASSGVNGGVLSGNTFDNLSLGGLNNEGLTAVCEVEYLILEAAMRFKIPQPTLSVLYDEKTPEDFLMLAAACTKMGMGFPAWMNNQGGINFMLNNYGPEGMTLKDARAWCLGGCLESSSGCFQPLELDGKVWMVPGGAGPTTSTGVHFLALPKILEMVLTNGYDHRTGKQLFAPLNKELNSIDDIWDAFMEYNFMITDVVNKANNLQMDIWRKKNMPIAASLLKPDCFRDGFHQGILGSRYNCTYNYESCGTITLVNSMTAIKKLVFDDKKYTLEELTDALLNNFGFQTAYETGVFSPDHRIATDEAPKYAQIFADCINAPKYGNADMYADIELVKYEDLMEPFCKKFYSCLGHPLYLCQISVSTHGAQGFITLATADGRLAGTTYADGSTSAASNTDKNGIYAIFESATVYDHSRAQNTQMNLKLHPSAVKGINGTRKLLDLIRAYMRKGGFHVQFNVVDSNILRKAQKQPEAYRDLMVRVAGFTQYWCEIGKPIQDEVIYRTEYEEA